jgi:hypothetical protein
MQKRLLGLILLIVVIAGASLWWYWQRPTKVVDDALAQLGTADTQHFHAVVVLENAAATQQILGEQGQVELNIDGVFARQPEKRDALAMNIALTNKTESVSIQLEGELRFIEEQAYLLIKKAPQVVPLLAHIKGTWIRLPRGGQQKERETPTPEQLFTNINRQGTEKVADATARKYRAVATGAAVLHLLDGIAELLGTQLTEDQIAGIRQSLGEVQEMPVELWITPWKHELKQLKTVLAVPGGNTINFTLTLQERNKPADITVPEGNVTLEETLQTAIAQQAPSTQQKSQPAPQKTSPTP